MTAFGLITFFPGTTKVYSTLYMFRPDIIHRLTNFK